MSIGYELLPPLDTVPIGVPPWGTSRPLPSATLPARADVLIVGAGITGLAAAVHLARADRSIVVIERRFGTGASARSGGIVIGDTLSGPMPEFDGCETALRNWLADVGAECDASWGECFELARNDAYSPHPVDWRDAGRVRVAGTIFGGVLDPVKLLVALSNAASRAGATIVDNAVFQRADCIDDGLAVSSTRGRIAAQYVVLASDAMMWCQDFNPWPERVLTVAMQTAPFTSQALKALGISRQQAFYTVDDPLLWGRVMPDGSLLIGRETLPFPRADVPGAIAAELSSAGTRLVARVRGLHPATSDVRVQRLWAGPIARTAAGYPAIIDDPSTDRILWAGGYGGHGIAQAFRLGQRLADRLLQRI